MTSNAQHLPVPQRRVIKLQPAPRSLALKPALALVASRALPAVTASVAAVATLLTAERAVRGMAEKLTPSRAEPAAPVATAVLGSTRTVITEWVTIERRKRAR
jgi:hypothetical protein